MKLITLNIWGGKQGEKVLDFVKKHKNEIDIFCFQEVFISKNSTLTPDGSRTNILGEISEILNEYKFYFSPTFHNRDYEHVVAYPLAHGQATFWKKDLNVIKKGEVFVHRELDNIGMFEREKRPDPPRLFQFVQFEEFLTINIHGYWEPAPKYDTPQRFIQSQKILEKVNELNIPTVLAGDFNLGIYTRSIQMLEEKMRNLVRESKAPTTRTILYDKFFREYDKYADYIFTTRDIDVLDFKVLKDVVSDHSPLYVKFSV